MISYNYMYVPGKTRTFYGTEKQLIDECNRTGEYVVWEGKQKNRWTISFSSIRVIFENVNGIMTRAIEPTLFILVYYNKKRVTKSDYIKLTRELSKGTVQFDTLYNEYAIPL